MKRHAIFSTFTNLLMYVGVCIASLSTQEIFAQQRKTHEKGTFTDSSQRYYQQASLPAYIFIGTSPEGKTSLLNPIQNGTVKPMMLDGHGKHYIRHEIPHKEYFKLGINADGKAPISTLKFFDAPSFQKNGKLYFGQNLKMSVIAKDEMSGLQTVYQSIDEAEFSEEVSKLKLDREKEYFVQYYAVDNVGNEENTQEKRFTVDLTTPQTNYTVKGDQIDQVLSPRSLVSLTAVDELSGVKRISYQINEDNLKTYTTPINFATLGDGEHTLFFQALDNVQNQEEQNSFHFYLDRMPPIINVEILGDKYLVQGKTFFSGRTKLQLEAMDNKAGVKEIYYSVDGASYQKYESPFYIPNRPGNHVVNYYAVDNVNNKGSGRYERTVTSMFMDLTGPKLAFNYSGKKFDMNNNVYISPQTKIALTAQDPESGVQNIDYDIDNTGASTYKQPFNIENEGTHTVSFVGVDNVNNTNEKTFEFIVDATPPEIFIHYSLQPLAEEVRILATSGNPKNDQTNNTNTQTHQSTNNTINNSGNNSGSIAIYPKHLTIFLGATDNMVGTENIYYSINGGTSYLYQSPLTNFPIGKVTKLQIKAIDKLGNISTTTQEFMIAK